MCSAKPPRDEAGFCLYGLQGWPGCGVNKSADRAPCGTAKQYERWRERECDRQMRRADWRKQEATR